MDDISSTNRLCWNALANANIEYSRPFLDLTREQAQVIVSRYGIVHDVAGKKVLCLAGGGGQDSAAFGLLGAEVTVFDLSDVQLGRDRQAAEHYGYPVVTHHGDMRDLSLLPDCSFDIVWQPYSINFVPSVEPVFCGVGRVLKPGGIYFLSFANPFVHTVDDAAWDGSAYPLKHLYVDGEDITRYYQDWQVTQPDGTKVKLTGPHEFRHTLGTVLNTLVSNGFVLLGLWEWMRDDENPEPGSWPHFTQIAPPWFSSFWRLEKAPAA